MAMGRPCLKILIVCFVVAGLAVGTDADDDIYNDGISHENAVYQPAARETSNDNHPAAGETSRPNDNQHAARDKSNGRLWHGRRLMTTNLPHNLHKRRLMAANVNI
ncbi:uncharacterized protein LOC119735374 [Patiria miniata]|uniref:Secreted protein n=1 Tax=Patiria miniata TaxID=46514 RepID=A0A914ALV2_PATMI|nr:uncharacterized protein LOC119735374 [Patiria miniata]